MDLNILWIQHQWSYQILCYLLQKNASNETHLKVANIRKKNKKWFDEDLQKCRNILIHYGTIYSKYPHDPLVKEHYYKLNKEYSRLRKYKYKAYQKHLMDYMIITQNFIGNY